MQVQSSINPMPYGCFSWSLADEDSKEAEGAIKNIQAIMRDWDVPSYMTVRAPLLPPHSFITQVATDQTQKSRRPTMGPLSFWQLGAVARRACRVHFGRQPSLQESRTLIGTTVRIARPVQTLATTVSPTTRLEHVF